MSVTFRDMTENEFSAYCDKAIGGYAEDLIHAGFAAEEDAAGISRDEYAKILPKGFHTPDADFHVILNSENEEAGIILVKEILLGVALIMDIEIKERFRRRGYARDALLLVESELAARYFSMIVLNVFEYNAGAKKLYESCGYTVFNVDHGAIAMSKKLISQD
ncbi:MAG: GNAT family N-acetyltransferase [Defluviitaleaceae bacterium]|nr:GNAT family N-acetyltransferase [Defluviitaleaceae bacterium]